jgi:hypothetical protein
MSKKPVIIGVLIMVVLLVLGFGSMDMVTLLTAAFVAVMLSDHANRIG